MTADTKTVRDLRPETRLGVLALVVALLLAACAPGPTTGPGAASPADAVPKAGGTLTLASFDEPRGMNVTASSSDVVAAQISANVFDTLVRYDPKTKTFKPELAESWENKDPLTWVLKLRKGVQFHNGYGEMTAEDVAWSANLIIDNKTSSLTYFPFIKNVTVVDPYTVQFNLTQPYTPFLAITAAGQGGIVHSKKAFLEKGATAIARQPVGTGPFVLESWTAGDRIILAKNQQYWDKGLPYLDKIVWRIVPDPVVRDSLLRLGEVDFIDVPEFKNLAEMSKDSKLVVTSTPAWTFDWLRLDAGKAPFKNQDVRQAISYAIDRRAIADAVYFGYATPTDNMLPVGAPSSPGSLVKYTERADVAKAKELLAKAGYANGFSTELMVGAADANRREAQIIADQLSKVGITVTISQVDNATFVKRAFKNNDFQMGLSPTTMIGPDPNATTLTFYHSNLGVAYYSFNQPDLDALLERGQGLPLGPERDAFYNPLVKRLVDHSFFIYLVNPPRVRVHSTVVKGFEIHPMDQQMIFRSTWLNR